VNGTSYNLLVQAQNIVGPGSSTSASNNPVTPAGTATTYTLTVPGGGTLNSAPSNFTVIPNAAYTGTITITPSSGGLSSATVLTFSNSSAAICVGVSPSSSR
jgi:hypothetical protein